MGEVDELNELVASDVLGWTLTDRKAMGWGNGPTVWLTGEDSDDENSNPTFQGFEPAVRIDHAWLVVQRMSRIGFHFLLLKSADSGLSIASFYMGPQDRSDDSRSDYSASVAICRAALATLKAGTNQPYPSSARREE